MIRFLTHSCSFLLFPLTCLSVGQEKRPIYLKFRIFGRQNSEGKTLLRQKANARGKPQSVYYMSMRTMHSSAVGAS